MKLIYNMHVCTHTGTHVVISHSLYSYRMPAVHWVKQRTVLVPTRRGFPGGAGGKEPFASAGDIRDTGSIPGSGRSSGGGHGNPLQYSCLENPVDRGAWQATVPRVAQSQPWLKWLSSSSSKITETAGRCERRVRLQIYLLPISSPHF